MALFKEVEHLRAIVKERDHEMNQVLMTNSDVMNKLAGVGFASPRDEFPTLRRATTIE